MKSVTEHFELTERVLEELDFRDFIYLIEKYLDRWYPKEVFTGEYKDTMNPGVKFVVVVREACEHLRKLSGQGDLYEKFDLGVSDGGGAVPGDGSG